MRIAENVYISEILKPGRRRLTEWIHQEKRIPRLYCITLPVWNSVFLDIYEYNQLLSSFYKEKDITIVGMAAGKQDALVILRRMVNELYLENHLEDAKSYFCEEIKL